MAKLSTSLAPTPPLCFAKPAQLRRHVRFQEELLELNAGSCGGVRPTPADLQAACTGEKSCGVKKALGGRGENAHDRNNRSNSRATSYRFAMATLMSIMPALPVRDIGPALDFYTGKLGFAVRHREGDGGSILVRDAAELHLTRLNDETWKTRSDFLERPVKSGAESFVPGTASVRIRVDDVRALHAECAARGVTSPIRERPWGESDFGARDPDGNLITFFQRSG
jgi:catechol 2,3-dioxygenase-like lactoylglutathione lyase family enzyme